MVFLQKASRELPENIDDINNVELGIYNQASASNTNTSIIRGQWWQAPFQFHRKWLHLLLKSRGQLAVAAQLLFQPRRKLTAAFGQSGRKIGGRLGAILANDLPVPITKHCLNRHRFPGVLLAFSVVL